MWIVAKKIKNIKIKKNSVLELLKKLNTFSEFLRLKFNNSKCKIACIRVLKAIEMVQRGMKCVNFKQGTIKIIGIHFSYDKKLKQEKNLCKHITEAENILKVWRMRQLLIERLINVFKLLAIRKARHAVPVTKLHSSTEVDLGLLQHPRWSTL